MGLSCKRYLAKLFLKILYGTAARKHCQAEVLGAVCVTLGAVQSVCPRPCARDALRNYFLSFCMELSCQSCLAKLFLKLLRGPVVQNLLCKAIFELLHGTVMQKLPCEGIAQAFAWNCRAKAALRNCFWSFGMELSCKSCLAKLFHKLLHGAVKQNMHLEAIFQARHYRARVAFWSYCLSFCMELSCKSCFFGAFSKAPAWNCRANGAFRSYLSSFYVELPHKSCLVKELSRKSYLTNYVFSLCMQLLCKSYFWACFLSFCMELLCKSCLSKLFLQLLCVTVVQKLACEAISQGEVSISIPWRCNLFLSKGTGLGRSLRCVGRSQISLFVMLRGSVLHKLPFAAASVGAILILMALRSWVVDVCGDRRDFDGFVELGCSFLVGQSSFFVALWS